jgi:hypothetical protein
MAGPSRIPQPPPKPAFPSDKHVREIERSYIRKHRLPQIRRAGLVSQTAVQRYIAAELISFERKDVLTKSYPLGDHVIICEGDSWFNHPFLRDIPELLGDFGYSVLHSNSPGKHLETSLSEGKFLAPLKDARKAQIKALLLSGGGNDLINWKKGNASFSPIFRKGRSTTSPSDYIDAANLKRALQDVTHSLVRISDKLAQAKASKLPVLLHCYDYIFPKRYGPSPLKGTWINPQLDAIGAPQDARFRERISGELQKSWIQAYRGACDQLGWHFIKTQDLVKDRWHDEIHPRNDGFYDISSAYWEMLHRLDILPSRKVTGLATADVRRLHSGHR